MGCIPSILAQSPTSRCSDEVNRLILPFNANMRAMINNLNSNLPGAKFIYIDIYSMFRDILGNSRNYGILSFLIRELLKQINNCSKTKLCMLKFFKKIDILIVL